LLRKRMEHYWIFAKFSCGRTRASYSPRRLTRMHRKLKEKSQKRHTSFGEYVLLILFGVFAFMTAGQLDNRGIPHKWATAIMGTVMTFGIVIYLCRRMWTRWAFWAAIGICLAGHTIVTWVFFQYVLYGANRFSILFWYPVMLVEVFVLLIAVKRIHDKLTGTRETIKLSF